RRPAGQQRVVRAVEQRGWWWRWGRRRSRRWTQRRRVVHRRRWRRRVCGPGAERFVHPLRGFPEREHHAGRSQDGTESLHPALLDRKSTRLNSSHVAISYAVFCLKKKSWTWT